MAGHFHFFHPPSMRQTLVSPQRQQGKGGFLQHHQPTLTPTKDLRRTEPRPEAGNPELALGAFAHNAQTTEGDRSGRCPPPTARQRAKTPKANKGIENLSSSARTLVRRPPAGSVHRGAPHPSDAQEAWLMCEVRVRNSEQDRARGGTQGECEREVRRHIALPSVTVQQQLPVCGHSGKQ